MVISPRSRIQQTRTHVGRQPPAALAPRRVCPHRGRPRQPCQLLPHFVSKRPPIAVLSNCKLRANSCKPRSTQSTSRNLGQPQPESAQPPPARNWPFPRSPLTDHRCRHRHRRQGQRKLIGRRHRGGGQRWRPAADGSSFTSFAFARVPYRTTEQHLAFCCVCKESL